MRLISKRERVGKLTAPSNKARDLIPSLVAVQKWSPALWVVWDRLKIAAVHSVVYSGAFLRRSRRSLISSTTVLIGLGTIYLGYGVLYQMSPQEVWYNKGVEEIRKDIAAEHKWTAFVTPDVAYLQKSILYYENQADAGLIDRILYGQPNSEYAAQAYLKVGVILLYNAGQDEKLLNEARSWLEKAVALNPGIPYARELLADPTRIDALAIEALAAERNLEMLYGQNPDQRSKKPDKSDGKKKGQGDKEGDSKNDQQKGDPSQPNDKPGDPNDKKNDQKGQASKNTTNQQNMQDVTNGTGNDGI